MVGSSQVLERIGIDLVGNLAMKCRVLNWIGVAMLVLKKEGNDRVLEKIDIV